MWPFKYLIVLVLLVQAFNCESEESFSVDLSPETFDEAVKENNHFVMFFAPWCGHCKRLHPLWEQLAELSNVKEDPQVIIAKVDCTVHQDLCSKNEVTGYPTLRFFKKGKTESVKFKGTRDLPTITDFIQEQLGNKNEVNEFSDDAPARKLIELTDESFAKHVSSGRHFVKFYAPWCSHCQRLAPTWDELATAVTSESVQIAKIDCTVYRPICQDFEVKGYPTLLWIEDGKKIEKYSGPRGLDELKAYVEKMLGSTVDQGEKQEEEKKPEENPRNVVQLTGPKFQASIDSGVTFIKFYAPWCGHCQKLSPVWDQLAEKIHTSNSGIKVAKVDCTLPENKELCVEQQVEGYPTLFAYKNSEKLNEYTGSRSLDDLYSFITKIKSDHDEL